MNYILYHENNQKYPYAPQEDAYYHSAKDGVFVVADGVTHDPTDPTLYPQPPDAYEVARIICSTVVESLLKSNYSTKDILNAYKKANHAVAKFNLGSSLYANRESNGYTIGAATTAAICIKGYKLTYGVLDDCFISVFGSDLVDHPTLKSYVDRSATYYFDKNSWADINARKYWRKELRNNKVTLDEEEYGYGAIDGRKGFEQYLQTGEVSLKSGDLVCVYTDGFIKLLKDQDFVSTLRNNPFTANTYEIISEKSKSLNHYKEKTAYFIKIN